MRGNRRNRRAGVIAVVGMLLVTGCTATEPGTWRTPPRESTVTRSASATAMPVPTTSEPEPTQTVERSRETAKQFILDYFEAYEEGLRTGSPEPLAGKATSGCATCAGVVAGLAGMKADRSSRPRARVTVVPFESLASTDPDLMTWTGTYESSLGDLVAGDEVVKAAGARTVTNVHVEIVHDGDAWLMNGMATDASTCPAGAAEDDRLASSAGDELSAHGTRAACDGSSTPSVEMELELGTWVDGDCASVPLTHVSAASWCASRETWAQGAPEYVCRDGSPARVPDKVRARPVDPPGQSWGPWRLNAVPCPDERSARDDDLREAVEREMARLEVEAAPALVAPLTGRLEAPVPVPVPTPVRVYTRAEPQLLEVSLAGSRVQIEVVPEVFSWDFGDGSAPWVTSDPGALSPPDQMLTHTFTTKGRWTVVLTTVWRARFRVVGDDTWREVDGRARTRDAAAPVVLREVRPEPRQPVVHRGVGVVAGQPTAVERGVACRAGIRAVRYFRAHCR